MPAGVRPKHRFALALVAAGALAAFGLTNPTFATTISSQNYSLSGTYTTLDFDNYINVAGSSGSPYISFTYPMDGSDGGYSYLIGEMATVGAVLGGIGMSSNYVSSYTDYTGKTVSVTNVVVRYEDMSAEDEPDNYVYRIVSYDTTSGATISYENGWTISEDTYDFLVSYNNGETGYTGYYFRFGGQWGDASSDTAYMTLFYGDEDGIPATAVNNGNTVSIGSLNLGSGGTLTQNSGSLTITGSVSGNGDIIINGGSLTVDGLVNTTAAKAATISARELFTPSTTISLSSLAAGTKASVDSVDTALSGYITMNGGTIVVSGTYNQRMRDEITSLLQKTFGSSIMISFSGTLDTAAELDLSNGYTTAVLTSIFTENNRSDVLFNTLNWNAESANQTVDTYSFGVKNVDNAKTITVTNGKTFMILGSDADTVLAGQSFAADNGTLILGAAGITSGGQAGTVTLSNGGALQVQNGTFTVSTLSGTGDITVSGGELYLTSAELNGKVTNSGTLHLNEFSFGSSGQLTSSGNLYADQDKLFSIEDSAAAPLEVVSLDGSDNQKAREVLTDLFQKYYSDHQVVLDEILEHAILTGGTLHVTNANLTETQRDDLIKAVQTAYGSSISVTFEGNVSGTSANDVLSASKVNEFYETVDGLKDVIYTADSFDGEGGTAKVGGDGGLKYTTGFVGVEHATATEVTGGSKLILVGTEEGGVMTDAPIKVLEGSTLELGSSGLLAERQGELDEISLDSSTLNVVDGDYTVKKLTAENSSEASIAEDAKATFTDVEVSSSSTLTNFGEMVVTGTLTGSNNGTIENSGYLKVQGTTEVAGTLINESRSEFYDTVNIYGLLSNAEDAEMYANTVNVVGTLANYGLIEAKDDSTVSGTLENFGEIRLYNTDITEGYVERSSLENTYLLSATGKTLVNGLLSNVEGAEALFVSEDGAEAAELRIGSSGEVQNAGYLVAEELVTDNGGTFTNTDTLSVTGKAQISGLLTSSEDAAVSFTNDDGTAELVVSEGGEVYSLGLLSADLVTVEQGGVMVNGEEANDSDVEPLSSIETIADLTVEEGGVKTNNSEGYYGEGTIAGTFINSSEAEAYAGVSEYYPEGEGLTVSETGQIENEGKFVFSGSLNNSGTIFGDGEIILEKAEGAENVFTNSGDISAGSFIADGIVFNQTAGTLRADDGWFENSSVNVTGGSIESEELGSGNTYTLGDGESSNTAAHYTLGTLSSDSEVYIYTGSTLEAAVIDMDGDKTTHLLGGVLNTTVDQVFDDVSTDTLYVEAENPNDTVTVTEAPIVISIGEVKDSVAEGIEFGYGTIVFNDSAFNVEMTAEALAKIEEIHDHDNYSDQDLELVFNGNGEQRFTVDLANQVYAEKDGQRSYATYARETLYNITADNPAATALIVGTGEGVDSDEFNVLKQSMGFMNIAEAQGAVVQDGYTLVLVGKSGEIGDESYSSEDNKLLLDSEDGGYVNAENGAFTFGSQGSESSTVGWINSSVIGQEGTLNAKNGEFADWTIENSGRVNIASNAVLHTNSLTGQGSVVNEGALYLDEHEETAPTLQIASGGFTNKGAQSLLEASLVDEVEVGGPLVNEGTAHYHDMVIAEGASNVNSGYESGNDLTVIGTHVNSGTSIWNAYLLEQGAKAENSGSLDVGENFIISEEGNFVNVGVNSSLDASKVTQTEVRGSLSNEGKADYQDMHIYAGASSVNSGSEEGNYLTVEGTHSNSGSSIWKGYDLAGGATGENSGTLELNEEFNVSGQFNNAGTLDATDVDNTQVTGSITNPGFAYYDDMSIAEGALSDNSGFEQGDYLHIADGGMHINSGTSIWNGEIIDQGGSSTNEEGSGETITTEYVIDGTKVNKGEVNAVGVETTEVRGSLDNQGRSLYDDMVISDGGVSDNSGYEKGDILTVETGAEHINSGTSIWNGVNVAGGSVNNWGDLEIGELDLDDGLFQIGDGSTTVDTANLNGGDLVVGNDKELSADNKATADINPSGVIDTNIYVKNNGDLNLGPSGGLDWADSIGAPQIPSTSSRLVITAPVTTGNGGIAVGPDVWSSATDHVELNNKDLYFADGSTTVIDASIIADGVTSAFTSTADGAKVTVEPGAVLVLGGIEDAGDFIITSNYDTSVNVSGTSWTGGWTDSDLYALPQDGSGIDWVLTLNNDSGTIWVNAVLADVRTVYPDIAIPNIANDSMNNCKYGEAGAGFVCGVLRDSDLSVADKTKILNSVANIAFAGGVMSTTMNELASVVDSVEGRVSFKGEAFDEQGVMKDWSYGNNLWIDVVGNWNKATSLKGTGIAKAGYEADSYGFVLGYDHRFDSPFILGGAFSYSKGDLDSLGDVIKTKNKYDTYGVHVYSAYSPNRLFNLIGSASWLRNAADIKQSINAAGFGNAKAKVDTDIWTAGIRAETSIGVSESGSFIPHIGARWINSKSGSYSTKVDGKKIWSTKSKANNIGQLPIGIAMRGDKVKTESGWTFRASADAAVIPQIGSTKQKFRVTNANSVSDDLYGQFAGHVGGAAKFGLHAEKGNATYGIRYGVSMGAGGRTDHSVKLDARYRF